MIFERGIPNEKILSDIKGQELREINEEIG
jgi:hypothetical protein